MTLLQHTTSPQLREEFLSYLTVAYCDEENRNSPRANITECEVCKALTVAATRFKSSLLENSDWDREVSGSNPLAAELWFASSLRNFWRKYYPRWIPILNQIDFWGRNSVCLKSQRIIRLLRQSQLKIVEYYPTRVQRGVNRLTCSRLIKLVNVIW